MTDRKLPMIPEMAEKLLTELVSGERQLVAIRAELRNVASIDSSWTMEERVARFLDASRQESAMERSLWDCRIKFADVCGIKPRADTRALIALAVRKFSAKV